MKNSTTRNLLKATFISQIFCFTFYITLTLLVVNLYGTNININLFKHLDGDNTILSKAVRFGFLVIFFCKIPYIFYPGKLSVFNMIREFRQNPDCSVCHHSSTTKGDKDNNYSKTQSNMDVSGIDSIIESVGHLDPMVECGEVTYKATCLLYITGVVVCACTFHDLSFLFGLCGACYYCMLDYAFPGLFFISACRYNNIRYGIIGMFAFGFVIIGALYFVLGNYFNFLKLRYE